MSTLQVQKSNQFELKPCTLKLYIGLLESVLVCIHCIITHHAVYRSKVPIKLFKFLPMNIMRLVCVIMKP